MNMVNKKLKIVVLVVIIFIAIVGVTGYAINKSRKNQEIDENIQRNYYVLYQNGKVGVLNTSGEILIEPVY